MARKHAATGEAWSAEVDTRLGGTLGADTQLFHVILNGNSTAAGNFFLSIEIPAQWSSNGKRGQDEIVCEVGQCKLTRATYNAERNKSARPDDIFTLYTQTEISDDCELPDRSGLLDASCWDSYFDPFSSRAYMALQYSGSEKLRTIKPEMPHPL